MPDETPSWFREIDHTGDVGIEVSASSRAALFERAALGMFYVLTDPEAVTPREEVEVIVEADDEEALLVRWLSELNFLHVTEGWLFSVFEVTEHDGLRLVAIARGTRYDAARHTIYTEIKAVTFHGLTIERRGDAWHARVIFDM
jgi:SHS2 domain-containing protein